MRGFSLSFSHSSPILLSGVLALSTHFLWAQGMLPLEKVPIQFVDTPAPFARFSKTQTSPTYGRLPLAFEQNQGQTDSRMTLLFAHYPSYYRLPANTGAALYPATRTTELRGQEKSVIGTAP